MLSRVQRLRAQRRRDEWNTLQRPLIIQTNIYDAYTAQELHDNSADSMDWYDNLSRADRDWVKEFGDLPDDDGPYEP